MHVLEAHAFRLPVRRFVLDLFDKKVMRRMVLDDGDDDNDDDDEGEDGSADTDERSKGP